jgi:anti-sigma factor RsiW
MKCSEVHRWIQLYLDGRLDGHRLPSLARHLRTCDACRDDLASYQAIVERVGAIDPLRQPEELTRAVMLRIRQTEARRLVLTTSRSFSLVWADAFLAAALATIVTIVFLFFQPALRASASGAFALTVTSLAHGVSFKASEWSPLVVWLVWAGLGVGLALWFAGREVRAGWRRTLLARLSR